MVGVTEIVGVMEGVTETVGVMEGVAEAVGVVVGEGEGLSSPHPSLLVCKRVTSTVVSLHPTEESSSGVVSWRRVLVCKLPKPYLHKKT